MASTHDVCKAVVEAVQDCLAVGVVDLRTGALMGVHHAVPHLPRAYLDAMAAAAVDMSRGDGVRRVEAMLSVQRGAEVKGSFEELFVAWARVFHFMRCVRDKEAVAVMVTRTTANQGIGWSSLRLAIDELRSTLP